jgi:hypothetical protein
VRRLLLRFERISDVHYAFKTLAYTLINLRHIPPELILHPALRNIAGASRPDRARPSHTNYFASLLPCLLLPASTALQPKSDEIPKIRNHAGPVPPIVIHDRLRL